MVALPVRYRILNCLPALPVIPFVLLARLIISFDIPLQNDYFFSEEEGGHIIQYCIQNECGTQILTRGTDTFLLSDLQPLLQHVRVGKKDFWAAYFFVSFKFIFTTDTNNGIQCT